MQLKYKQADTTKELKQILHLQQKNLPEKLSVTELEREGFVTVRHNLEILAAMNDVCGHIIAMDGEFLAGYALCMHPEFSNLIPVLKPMFHRLQGLLAPSCRYLVMGQICIDPGYRARGVFRGLYSNMQIFLRPEFGLIITEVDTRNIRSMGAHKAIGFTKLIDYSSGGQDWEILQLPTVKPGLQNVVK